MSRAPLQKYLESTRCGKSRGELYCLLFVVFIESLRLQTVNLGLERFSSLNDVE